jgi:hypothetical protein
MNTKRFSATQEMSEANSDAPDTDSRRGFLQKLGVLAPAVAALPVVAEAAVDQPPFPRIRLGKYSISRLILGSNPVGGTSHLSDMLDKEMRAWFTPERLALIYKHCLELGINCMESGKADIIRKVNAESGGKAPFYFFSRGATRLVDDGDPDPYDPRQIARNGCIGIMHVGYGEGGTDAMFRTRQLGKVREYTKRVRDAGVLVGITSHMPEAIAEIESQGWDVDYYMTCVYRYGRLQSEWEELYKANPDAMPVEVYHSKQPIWPTYGGEELFVRGDPPKMYKVIKQVKKPCLAYKILAAGRLCEKPEFVAAAFEEAFANIKPSDAVVVGMWDKQMDQFAINAQHVRRFGSNAGA